MLVVESFYLKNPRDTFARMKGKIASQSLWASIVNYSGSLIGLFTAFYLFPLVYTEAQNGIIRLFIEMGALLAGVAQIGTGYSIWKFFPIFRNNEKNHNGAGFWIAAIPFAGFILVSISLLIFQPIVIKYLGKNSAEFLPYYIWLLPFIFFFVYNTVFEIFSASLGNIIYSSFLRENAVRILLGLIGFIFYLKAIPFRSAVLLTPAVYAITALLNLYFILRVTSISLKPDFAFVRQQQGLRSSFSRYTGYLFVASVANLFIQRLDFAMVSSMKGLTLTGVYSIAVNLAVLIEIPTRSILQISNPHLADAIHRKDRDEVDRLYQKTTLNQFILGCLVLLLIWINIDVFYYLMPNGEKYASGKLVVLILGIGKLFILLQGNSSAMLTFSHRYYYSLFTNLTCVFLGIYLNTLLIPQLGINGAAVATALTWLANGLVTGILIYSLYKLNPYKSSIFLCIGLFLILFGINEIFSIPRHMITTAAIKTILLPSIALFIIYKFRLSDDMRSIIDNALGKLKKLMAKA